MRYRTLIKWHSRAFLLLECHESHRLYNVEPLSISPQMYQRERRQSHEAPENALIAAHSTDEKLTNQHSHDFAHKWTTTIGYSHERDTYKSPRGATRGCAGPSAPCSPLKRSIVPVDKQFKILALIYWILIQDVLAASWPPSPKYI